MAIKSDHELVEKARAGDATAIAALLERHDDFIYRLTKSIDSF
jgi:hypothetical protein